MFQSFLNFAAYFASAIALVFAFQFAYTSLTPHREIELIKQNNVGAAISYIGALIGFILPVASTIAHSVDLLDFLTWATVAGTIQIATFLAFRQFYGDISARIQAGETAVPLKLAGVSVGIGILNAACLTY
jgi:putative membrane protein